MCLYWTAFGATQHRNYRVPPKGRGRRIGAPLSGAYQPYRLGSPTSSLERSVSACPGYATYIHHINANTLIYTKYSNLYNFAYFKPTTGTEPC
jgi:hypothetical protein